MASIIAIARPVLSEPKYEAEVSTAQRNIDRLRNAIDVTLEFEDVEIQLGIDVWRQVQWRPPGSAVFGSTVAGKI
jgi:hypothetical protein